MLSWLRENDSLALAELYERYHEPLYYYVIGLVKVPETAEDIVHEIFLKIWEIRERLEIKESFRSYLFRIAHNKAADAIKTIARNKLLKEQLLNRYSGYTAQGCYSTEQLWRFDRLVEEAIESLPPQRRKVFELCRRQGKSYQQAANELGISLFTVREHMTKALASLRKFVREKGELMVFILFLEKF